MSSIILPIAEKQSEADRTKQILRERAALLAKANEVTEAQEGVEGLCFLLSDEHYLIESSFIVEVLPLNELTPLPCTPSFIIGIINVRGRILSVISLKKFLNLPEKGITNMNRVIVVKFNEIEIGIIADEIMGIQPINIGRLQTDLPTLNSSQKEYIAGITPNTEIVFNLKKFLTSDKIIINEEV